MSSFQAEDSVIFVICWDYDLFTGATNARLFGLNEYRGAEKMFLSV